MAEGHKWTPQLKIRIPSTKHAPDATPEDSATLQGSESGAPGAKVSKGEKLQPGTVIFHSANLNRLLPEPFPGTEGSAQAPAAQGSRAARGTGADREIWEVNCFVSGCLLFVTESEPGDPTQEGPEIKTLLLEFADHEKVESFWKKGRGTKEREPPKEQGTCYLTQGGLE
ncbi:hypothetical protein HispidOSU_019226 [Sigmodon hispidus]